MSAVAESISAPDVAKGLSIFEIDESLAALVEAAEADAEANNGELSEPIKEALVTYAEAFGYKVDRIASFLKAQKAEARLKVPPSSYFVACIRFRHITLLRVTFRSPSCRHRVRNRTNQS